MCTQNQISYQYCSVYRTILMLGFVLSLSAVGCQKADTEPGAGGSSASSQKEPRKFQDNVELSTVKGVSIVQLPEGTLERPVGYTPDLTIGTARSGSVSAAIYAWCDFAGWIIIDANLPDAVYEMTVRAQEGGLIWPLAKKALEDVFELRFVEGKEMLDVVVLQKAEDSPHGLVAVEAKGSSWGTAQTPGGFGYEVRAGNMEDLTKIVSEYVEESVLDETGLSGYYKFTLVMDHWKPKTVFPAVEKLGLKLVKTKRELPVMRVVVAPKEAPASGPASIMKTK